MTPKRKPRREDRYDSGHLSVLIVTLPSVRLIPTPHRLDMWPLGSGSADLVYVVSTGFAGLDDHFDGFDGIDVGDRLVAGSADTVDAGHGRHQALVRVSPKTAIKLPACLASMVNLPSSRLVTKQR